MVLLPEIIVDFLLNEIELNELLEETGKSLPENVNKAFLKTYHFESILDLEPDKKIITLKEIEFHNSFYEYPLNCTYVL